MRHLFFCLLIIHAGPLFSQTGNADPKKLNDSATWYHDHSNFTRAQEFALAARTKAEELGIQAEVYRSYSMLGAIEFRKGYLKKARDFHQKSLTVARQAEEPDWKGKALSNLASMLSQLGEYDSAELLLTEATRIKNLDSEILMTVYGRLGANLKRQQQYDRAIHYYVQSLAISREHHDSLASARTLANMGNIYMEQKDAVRALEYFHQALSLLDSGKHAMSISGITNFASDAYQTLGKYDEAEKYLNKSLKLSKNLNLPASEAYALESLGILHFNRKKVKEAISAFNQALALQRTLDSWSGLESVLLQLTECHIHTREFEKAQTWLNEGKKLAEEHKHALGLQSVYQLLSKLDSARGDYRSSLLHYKRSVHYKDSLFTVEKAKAVEEVNRKFEAQQREKIIDEQKLIIGQQQTRELFFILLSAVVVLSTVVVYFFIQRRQRMKRNMEHEQLQKQKLLAVVIAQEQMQQKIARDLHDSFVQILGAAKINLESAKAQSSSAGLAAKIQDTADIIDKACTDARTIAHQLLPYSLEKHGLPEAIQELVDKTPRKGVEIYDFRYTGITGRLKNSIEINVYRIVQELIHNSIKHASACGVKIYLSQQNDRLVLSVTDDGKGFDIKRTPRGAGLMNIESRLQSIRGTMRIESEAGTGTTTIIQIPLA